MPDPASTHSGAATPQRTFALEVKAFDELPSSPLDPNLADQPPGEAQQKCGGDNKLERFKNALIKHANFDEFLQAINKATQQNAIALEKMWTEDPYGGAKQAALPVALFGGAQAFNTARASFASRLSQNAAAESEAAASANAATEGSAVTRGPGGQLSGAVDDSTSLPANQSPTSSAATSKPVSKSSPSTKKGQEPSGPRDEIVVTSQQKVDLSNPNWRNVNWGKPNDSIVYILKDAKTGQILKIGKSEVANVVDRFGKYEQAAKYTGRQLELDVVSVPQSSMNLKVGGLENQIRQNALNAGESLPWDNSRIPGVGTNLGRPGPGVPGTRWPSRLQRQGWEWQGENAVQRSAP